MSEIKITIKALDKVSKKLAALCVTAEDYVERARQVCWNIKTRDQAVVALRFLNLTGKFIAENKKLKRVIKGSAAPEMRLAGIAHGLQVRWNIRGIIPPIERNLS